MKPCPRCKSDDLDTDSVANGGSFIECNDCEYRLVGQKSEEALTRDWNKLDRSSPPLPLQGGEQTDLITELDFTPDEHHSIADMANIGYYLMKSIKSLHPDFSWLNSPAEIVGYLTDEIYELKIAAVSPQVGEGEDLPIELREIPTALAEQDGAWVTCTGCHESSEGAATGPFSKVMQCTLGMGCRECGGIGAVWDYSDYSSLSAAPAVGGEAKTCEYCDGTGDVHDQTGEWRGTCTCPAGQGKAKAVAWTDDQMIRFGNSILIQGNLPESIERRLKVFREHEDLRGAFTQQAKAVAWLFEMRHTKDPNSSWGKEVFFYPPTPAENIRNIVPLAPVAQALPVAEGLADEFFAVLSPNGEEGVIFKNEDDAKYTATGKSKAWAVPTIGEALRESYADDAGGKLKMIRVAVLQGSKP